MAGELERVRKTLRELGKSLESLTADPAPRKVHKLRTASRRVEAVATLLDSPKKSRRLLKAIEPVRKAAGGVRDMDVLLGHARKLRRYGAGESLTRLLDHLETARQQHAAELARVLHHRHHVVLRELKDYSRMVASELKRQSASTLKDQQERINDATMRAMRELAAWQPLDADNLHEFRLKIKNLRYTLQLDDAADTDLLVLLDDAQHRIGDWHDWQQLAEIAHEVLIREQDSPLVDQIDQTATKKFERAIAAANALRGKYLSAPMAAGI